ncbi:MAG: uncharacterized protein A8A55_1836 [Amphiamblys sp. WSBS2006]|nr:MAG: uncharacterized protein A8A55_1836 [Amphiamblys sp. WSBS2006]
MDRRGIYVAPEHLEETTERRRWKQYGSSSTTQPRLVDSLVLTVAELSARPVLLDSETVVYLPTTGLSDTLFFRLLEKTTVVFGGTVSLFEHLDGKDCIREGMGVECREEVRLSPPAIKNTALFMENVARIPENSIWLGKVKNMRLERHAINLLPKLWLHENNMMEELCLNARFGEYVFSTLGEKYKNTQREKMKNLGLEQNAINFLQKLREENVMEMEVTVISGEDVSETLGAKDSSIWLGKMRKLRLERHAINLLPKLRLHEDNVMEEFHLDAGLEEYVFSILRAKEKSIWLGKVKNLRLERCAINLLPKLRLHEDSEIQELYLDTEFGEYVFSILGAEDNSIWLGKVKSLKLEHHAINLLPKLWLHEDSEMEELKLDAEFGEHVSEILGAGDRSIWLGKVRKLRLERYGISLLPKLRLHEDNAMEKFSLGVINRKHVSEILHREDRSIWLGKAKKMVLMDYAISLLPKLMLHEDNVVDELWLDALEEEYVSKILWAKDRSIWLGARVKTLRLGQHAVSILPKLKLHGDNVVDTLVIINVCRDMLQKHIFSHTIQTPGNTLKSLSSLDGDDTPGTTPADGGCCGWKIKQLKMDNSTVYALQGIRSDKSCVLDRFELTNPREEDTNRVFESDERVYLGKIKEAGLVVPPSIKAALIYTLVDEEGNNPIH